MAEGIDGAGLGRAAARAGAALGAAYSAGRGGGLLPRAEFMLGFGSISVLVAVAAFRTGVGSISLSGAGRFGRLMSKIIFLRHIRIIFPNSQIIVICVERADRITDVIDNNIPPAQAIILCIL